MTNHPASTAVRRASRALVLTFAVAATSTAAPALAAPPETWTETDPVSPLSFLLVLLLIPAGLFLVIALLAWLPTLGKNSSGYQPGLAWRHEPEWFGGRRDGSAELGSGTATAASSGRAGNERTEQRGGASGRW